MVSTCPLISKSTSLFKNTLGIVSNAQITTGITVTFMFQSLFFLVLEQGLDIYLSFYFLLILLCCLPRHNVNYSAGSLFFFFSFLLTITRSSRLAEIRRSVSFTKFQWTFILFLIEKMLYYYFVCVSSHILTLYGCYALLISNLLIVM